jgi:hypothetical protein
VTDRRLAGWVAQDVGAHLDELVAAARRWRDGTGERPVVTVHVASGERHTGHVLDVVRATLAMQSIPQRGTADLDVVVIPLARIEALTLHAAQSLVAAAPVPAENATSMLELKRRAKALADVLATRVGRAIAIDIGAGELAQLAPLFETVKLALDRVCADELGRGSLAERVQRIELRAGTPGVSLANATLAIAGPLAPARLQSELDAAL